MELDRAFVNSFFMIINILSLAVQLKLLSAIYIATADAWGWFYNSQQFNNAFILYAIIVIYTQNSCVNFDIANYLPLHKTIFG